MENCIIWILLLLAYYSQFSHSSDRKLNESVKTSEEYYSASGIAGVFHLERLLPETHVTSIDALVARDRARHARILQTATSELVNFLLNSSFDLNNIGIYYTKVKVGSPPKEYTLLIDTGSDISTSSASAPIIFGCSTTPLSTLVLSDNAIDGILGFDRRSLSIVSQLSSRGISGKVFSHCLKGERENGGGILVLGEIQNPNMVYTPLVPSTEHYNVDLQSIAVNEKLLQIDPVVFATSEDRGTFFDSGTTLIHLVAEAYDSVINAINIDIPSSVESTMSGGTPCYLVSSRSPNNVTKIFPRVALNFAGGVSMELRPTNYLSFIGDFWCILLISKAPSMTILGDIALRDKSIVYDLVHQRIGWADQDCSLPMNVSISSGVDQVVNYRVLFHILSMLCIFLFWG